MDAQTNRFKSIRESLSMTQEEFAEKLNVSPATVRKIEGGSNLTVQHAIKIRELFGFSLDYIYGLCDDTNDDASTMMLYLKKLFDFSFDSRPGYERFPYSLCVRKCAVDFLNGYAQAKELLDAGTIPPAAFTPWVDKLKSDFNASVESDASFAVERYRLVPEKLLEPKTVTIGAPTCTPPMF